MGKIQFLNNISIIVDGSDIIPKEDIVSVSISGVGQEPIEGKTFGGAFHAIPISGTKTLSITVKAEGKGQQILSRLYNEYVNSPEYHVFTVYDGTATTTAYNDCLVYDCSTELNVDSVVNWTYQISSLMAKVDVDENNG